MRENKCYKVTNENGEEIEVWDGRYTCVCGIVLAKHEHNIYVLANKRGPGCPKEVGKWNMPCGFLNAGSAKENVAREVFEETGVKINPEDFEFIGVNNTGKERNVTLRYMAILEDITELCPIDELRGGEPNEVSEIKWISLLDTPNYEWAFNHLDVLGEIVGNILIPMIESVKE